MKVKANLKRDFYKLYWNTTAIIIMWTLMLIGSIVWNIRHELASTKKLAEKEARAILRKDLAFRIWATSHGGVYVPPDERTPPNPYLSHIPERDITTLEGKPLTLMNPAYMLRQIMSEYQELYGIKGHITSLKLINPINIPDTWERKALETLEQGVEEVATFTTMEGGESYLRLMRPMITTKGCLKCHAHQNYKAGDVRGGVSIAVPLKPYFALQQANITILTVTHGVFFLLGILAIGFVSIRSRQSIIQRKQSEEVLLKAHEELESKVDERTLELREVNEQLKITIDEQVQLQDQLIRSERLAATGKLAASVAHEINSPLQAVTTMLSTLKETYKEDKKLLGNIDLLKESFFNIRNTVKHLLDLNRPDKGRKQSANINKTIEDTVKLVRSHLKNKRIKLNLSLSPNIPDITVSVQQMSQVFLNLINNAVEAMTGRLSPKNKEGFKSRKSIGGEITIKTDCSERDIIIIVSDTGPGISKKDIQHNFRLNEKSLILNDSMIIKTKFYLLPT